MPTINSNLSSLVQSLGNFWIVKNSTIPVYHFGLSSTNLSSIGFSPMIKEETVVHLHKTKEVNDNLNMVKETIGDLLLEVQVLKTWRRKSSIRFVEDDMHKVNVGSRGNVMVVAIVGETRQSLMQD